MQTLRAMPGVEPLLRQAQSAAPGRLGLGPLGPGFGARWPSLSCSSQFGSHFLWASSQKTGGPGVSKLIPSKDTSRQNLLTI